MYVLAGHLLLHRQDGLQLADVDQHVLRVLALLDHTGDDVALAARVLAERRVVLGVAQPLQDDLLGGGRGDPAEAGRGVVELRGSCALLQVRRGPPSPTRSHGRSRRSSSTRA